ncbi:hypothetical protein [Devosia sp. 1635]|uniref:hypothetical protein n=1 Tax=Devosia sp. 1635 TaxID=2726066 RepID=UPI0015677E16|nr:hypothetical protein [Devosia sp. 1635]
MAVPTVELARLGQYNAGIYNASSNPYGMDNYGYATNLPLAASDVAAVANYLSTDLAPLAGMAEQVGQIADIADEIALLAPRAANITTLAALSTQLTTLASIASNITAAANNATNISAVAGNSGNINTVAGIGASVTSVAAALTNINAVAAGLANIATVVGMATNIATVAAANAAITAVAGGIGNVNAVSAALTPIGRVAAIDDQVATVASVAAGITTLAGMTGNISTVAADSAKITTLAPASAAITTVAGSIGNVNTVAGANTSIATVAGVAAAVTTVAGVASNLSAVVANADDIQLIGDNIQALQSASNNMAAIVAAPGHASNAASSAGAAQTAAQAAKRTALFFQFSTSTADSDPGTGTFRLNNAAPTDASALFIDLVAQSGGDVTTWLDTWDDSDNPGNRGELTFIDAANHANWLKLRVTGANTSATGYRKIAVSYVDHNGTLANNALFSVEFRGTGNQGASGAGTGTVQSTGAVMDARIAIYDGVSGNFIKDGGKALGDLATSSQGAKADTALQPAVVGVTVQAFDADLAAIAGLTSAANTFPYFTGSGTAALGTVTSAGRALLDDPDAAAMRTTLGVAIGTNVMAYDAELAALAGLVSAADKLPYFTGAGTASLADFTAFGRSLVDDVNAAAAQVTLGLVPGTNVQAYDPDLAALASVTSAANALPYFTGSGTAAVTTLSAFARTLLDDTSQAAMQATMGLGTASTAAATDFAPVSHVGSGGAAHAAAIASGANGFMTGADKAKLDGVAAGATANDTDTNLRNRANHTGTQPANTISGLATVATTGVYADLTGRPTLGTASAQDTGAFAQASHVGSGGTAHAEAVPGGASGFMSGADKSKLNGVAAGATANSADAALLSRDNHTGTQAISTVDGLQSALDGKMAAGSLGTAAAMNEATVAEVRSAAADKVLTAELISSAADLVTLTDTTTISVNWASFLVAQVTLGGNRTLANPTNVQTGTTRYILVKGSSTIARTLSFGTSYKGDLPADTVTTTAWLLIGLTAITSTHIVVTSCKAL